jgi:hypothetical protein
MILSIFFPVHFFILEIICSIYVMLRFHKRAKYAVVILMIMILTQTTSKFSVDPYVSFVCCLILIIRTVY